MIKLQLFGHLFKGIEDLNIFVIFWLILFLCKKINYKHHSCFNIIILFFSGNFFTLYTIYLITDSLHCINYDLQVTLSTSNDGHMVFLQQLMEFMLLLRRKKVSLLATISIKLLSRKCVIEKHSLAKKISYMGTRRRNTRVSD